MGLKDLQIFAEQEAQLSNQSQVVNQSLSRGLDENPDEYAKALKLAAKTGVAPQLAKEFRPELEKRVKMQELSVDDMIRTHPKTAQFLANPDNAAVAQDDVGVLKTLENTIRAVPAGLEQGWDKQRQMFLNFKEVMGNISPSERAELVKLEKLGEKRSKEFNTGLPSWTKAAGDTLGMLGFSTTDALANEGTIGAAGGAAIGATFVGIGAVPGAVGGLKIGTGTGIAINSYESAVGEVYDDLKNFKDPKTGAKLDPVVARYASLIAGAPSTALELFSLKKAVKLIPGADKLLGKLGKDQMKEILVRPTMRAKLLEFSKDYATAVGTETFTEGLQKFVSILAREAAQEASPGQFTSYNKNQLQQDADAIVNESTEAFKSSVVLGGVGGSVKVYQARNEVKKAEQSQAVFEALGKTAQDSKTLKNIPEKYREFVETAKQDGPVQNVYVDSNKFSTFFQSQGQDPEAVAQELGVKNYREAMAAGSDVVIPIEHFAEKIAPTQYLQGLMQDARLRQGDLSLREAQEELANQEARQVELEAQMQSLVAEQERQGTINTAIKEIVTDIEGQLRGAGYDASTAASSATVMRGMAILAERDLRGRAAAEGREVTNDEIVSASRQMWGKYGLTVSRPMPGVLATNPQGDITIDPLLDALRAGAFPTDQQVFGSSLAEFIRDSGGLVDMGETRTAQENMERRPFQRNLVQKDGMSIDKALELAVQAGYFPGQTPGDLTEADFLDALDNDLRGGGVFSVNASDNNAMAMRQAMNALGEYLDSIGVDLNAITDNAQVRALIDQARRSPELGPMVEQLYQAAQQLFGNSVQLPATIEVDGKQRPTTNSNGQPIHPTEEGVRNFWRWFGDSYVTEAAESSKQKRNTLRPLVVYHGTRADFDSFSPVREGNVVTMFGDEETVTRRGIFFAENPDFAATFAKQQGEGSPKTIPVYLNIQNPLYLDDGFTRDIIDELRANGLPEDQAQRLAYRKADMAWAEFDDEAGEVFIAAAKAAGYDGVYMVEPGVGLDGEEQQTVWVAFTPEQIKSATGNTGAFSATSGNILYQGAQDGRYRKSDTTGDRGVAGDVAGQNTAQQVVRTTLSGEPAAEGWASGTRIVRGGSPLTVFRGSKLKLSKSDFDLEALGKASGKPSSGLGVWFTTGEEEAREYGNVAPVQLDIRNPAVIRFDKLPGFDSIEEANRWREKLRKQGYDGIILHGRGLGKPEQHIVVFDPKQVVLPEQSNTLYQFAGQSARTADVHALSTAQQRIEAGEAAEQVRQQTGWFKGSDGKWRYEISDADARLKGTGTFGEIVMKRLDVLTESGDHKPGDPMRLQDILQHTSLFAAYPSLRNAEVEFMPKGKTANASIDSDGVIRVRDSLPAEKALSALLHEVQHGIQAIEGFATGGSEQGMTDSYLADKARIDDLESKMVRYENKYSDEARFASKELKAKATAWADEQGEFFQSAPIEEKVKEYLLDQDQLYKDWFKEHAQLKYTAIKIAPSERYRRLAGEVEARNTQTRQRMTDAERAATPPSATADVADGNVIVVFNGKEMSSAPTPENAIFAQSQDDKRGFIQFGAERKFNVVLLEKANLSTFLHETGHFYLEVLGDLATAEGAPKQITDDYAAALKYLGVESRDQLTLDGKAKGSAEYNRAVAAHEKFAESFEVYLKEGNAPTPELRSVFQQFKQWLRLVYDVLKQGSINIKLTDEVRGVFDRILASDAEIEAAKNEVNVDALFLDAAAAGMSPQEFELYRDSVAQATESGKDALTAKLMRELMRERKAWWKEASEKMREQVADEVDAQPVYMAFKTLVDGDMDGIKIKLNKQSLVDKYGAEYVKRLPRGFQRIYTNNGGMDADAAAEFLGYNSGDALVEALVGMRNRNELIDAETDVRMRETYGDMMTDGTIADEAKIALHNSQRENVLMAELRALRRKQRDVAPFVQAERDKARQDRKQARAATDVPPAEAFRRAAQGIIGQTALRDLNANQYLLASRKAARQAFEAMGKGDYMLAADAKQKELLNHFLYLEARKAQEQADKVLKYAQKFEKGTTREQMGKAGGTYLEQIDAILDRYEFRRVPLSKIDRRASLAEWIAEQEADGMEPSIDPVLLNESRLVNYRQASIDELMAIYDAVRNIEHLARLKNKLKKKQDQVEFEDAIGELVASAENMTAGKGDKPVGKRKPLPLSRAAMTRTQKAGEAISRFDAALLKMEQVVEWLDNGDVNGPWHTYVWNPIAQAQVREYDLTRQVTEKLASSLEKMPKERRLSMLDTYEIQGIGKVTRKDLISVALNMGNQGNIDKMMRGMGWDMATIERGLSKLDDADWTFVQDTWDTINSLWPEIAALEKSMTGLEPPKIDAQQYQVRDEQGNVTRTLAGGYYPLVYDARFSEQGAKQETGSLDQLFEQGYVRATTPKGHTQARSEGFAAPLLLDFEQVVTQHMAKVIKDLTHREAIVQANRIFTNREVRSVLQETMGEAYEKQFLPWLRSVVNDRNGGSTQGLASFSSFMMTLRANVVAATMGFKATTMLVQITGLSQSIDKVKGRYLGQALLEYMRHPVALTNEVRSLSGEMRNRSNTLDRDIRDQLRNLTGQKSPYAKVQRFAFHGIAVMDAMVTVPTWRGAYAQAIAEGKDKDTAILEADAAVRLTQGAGGAKDLSAVQRNNELTKMLTMFYSYFSVLYNRQRDMGRNVQEIKDMPKFLARAFFTVMVPAVIGDLMLGRGPDDEEDEAAWAIRKVLTYPLMSVPLLRDIASTVESGYDYRFTPLSTIGERIAKVVVQSGDMFDDDMEWGDYAANVAQTIGYTFGVAGTAQITATSKYLWRVNEGEENPDNMAELLAYALLGKRKKD